MFTHWCTESAWKFLRCVLWNQLPNLWLFCQHCQCLWLIVRMLERLEGAQSPWSDPRNVLLKQNVPPSMEKKQLDQTAVKYFASSRQIPFNCICLWFWDHGNLKSFSTSPKKLRTVVASNDWSEHGSSGCEIVTPLPLDLPNIAGSDVMGVVFYCKMSRRVWWKTTGNWLSFPWLFEKEGTSCRGSHQTTRRTVTKPPISAWDRVSREAGMGITHHQEARRRWGKRGGEEEGRRRRGRAWDRIKAMTLKQMVSREDRGGKSQSRNILLLIFQVSAFYSFFVKAFDSLQSNTVSFFFWKECLHFLLPKTHNLLKEEEQHSVIVVLLLKVELLELCEVI